MATGDLVTDDWTFEYRGLAFGGTSDLGVTPGSVGFIDLPDVVTSDRRRLRRHGQYPGDDFLGGREIIIPVEVAAADGTTATWETRMSAIKQAMTVDPDANPVEDALCFQIPGVAGGGVRRINCRPRGFTGELSTEFYYEIPTVALRFWATSPFILDNTLTTVTSPILSGSSSGLTWPLTWPLTWGTVTASTFEAVNSGTARAEWVATITGPVTNPVIQHVGQGRSLTFTLVVAAGQTLVVDSDARTVLLNGTASRYYTKSGDWFSLAPGSNTLSFRATAGTGTLSIDYRSTWS